MRKDAKLAYQVQLIEEGLPEATGLAQPVDAELQEHLTEVRTHVGHLFDRVLEVAGRCAPSGDTATADASAHASSTGASSSDTVAAGTGDSSTGSECPLCTFEEIAGQGLVGNKAYRLPIEQVMPHIALHDYNALLTDLGVVGAAEYAHLFNSAAQNN